MNPLRLIFFGTPEIAVPTLERLLAGPHEVVGVISQPDRARGRGRQESPSPVSKVALREGIPLLRPERIAEAEEIETLEAMRPDVGVVVAFGQFLPRKVRELPSRGYLINAHASLLPKYRGASPIAQAILDGEAETGVSVMRIEREMDAGPVALVVKTPIAPSENTLELSNRLAKIAAGAIEEAVHRIARGDIEWTPQTERMASLAPKIEKSDVVLDLRESARRVACRIHALAPKPGAQIILANGPNDAIKNTALKILRADVAPFDTDADIDADADADSGRDGDGVLDAAPTPGGLETGVGDVALRIATGDGWLVPLVMQRAGGKPLPIADFLRGFELPADARCALPGEESP